MFLLEPLMRMVDGTIHPDIKKRGGMGLLRGRMLSLSSIMAILACLSFLSIIFLAGGSEHPIVFIYVIMGQGVLFLILNRMLKHTSILAALSLTLFSVLMAMGIYYQARSILAPGFLWFPVLIMPAFLLCGWRLGLLVSSGIAFVAIGTFIYCLDFGGMLPFAGDRLVGFRALKMTVVIANVLTLGLVTIYFHLLLESERKSIDQKKWLQRTARMQELLQMSGHFALQTNGPLDVLGTALHNLEKPLLENSQPVELLPWLEPLEASIQDLATVARSFSLFSRRYLEEGLEQTSINAILQHVNMIYNVGSVMGRARLQWDPVTPDILIHTQTARLVMLLISILRSLAAAGGTRLVATVQMNAEALHLELRYDLTPYNGTVAVQPDVDVVFDPEMTEDLIQELCNELVIQRHQGREGTRHFYTLTMLPFSSQARLA